MGNTGSRGESNCWGVFLRVSDDHDWEARYNIAPTQPFPSLGRYINRLLHSLRTICQAGFMFGLSASRFVGSYFFFIAASRL